MRACIKIISNLDQTVLDQEDAEFEPITHTEALERLLARLPHSLRDFIVRTEIPYAFPISTL